MLADLHQSSDQPLILLVEDDPTLRSTLVFNLTREGYGVIAAEDGLIGLAAAREYGHSLSLIVLDVMLPGMNGFQVLRHVRQTLSVPVLMLSARGEERDRIDGFELGADDYVVKPFALRELLARIRSHVRRHANPSVKPPSVLLRGPLRIETDHRTASVNDEELRLRPKEFGLLATIAMEPGRVFSREELLETVWGDDVIVDTRTVDVHISWLRAKLVAAGMTDDVIRTVYGAGYRFLGSSESEPPGIHSGPTMSDIRSVQGSRTGIA